MEKLEKHSRANFFFRLQYIFFNCAQLILFTRPSPLSQSLSLSLITIVGMTPLCDFSQVSWLWLWFRFWFSFGFCCCVSSSWKRAHTKALIIKVNTARGVAGAGAEPVGRGCQGYHRLIVIDWMKILSEKFKMKGEKNSHVIKIKSLLWLSSEYGKDFYGYLLFEPAEIKQTYRKNKTTTTTF